MIKVLFTKKVNLDRFSFSENIEIDTLSLLEFESQKFPNGILDGQSLIFSSVNGVKVFFEVEKSISKETSVYCVGGKTKLALEYFGVQVKYTAKNAASLALHIKENIEEERFVHFCGNLAFPIFKNEEVNYRKIEIYKTKLLYPKLTKKYDAVVFFSPSGVESFTKNNTFEKVQLFSIGQTTTKALHAHTKNTIFTSSKNTLEDLINRINEKY